MRFNYNNIIKWNDFIFCSFVTDTLELELILISCTRIIIHYRSQNLKVNQ